MKATWDKQAWAYRLGGLCLAAAAAVFVVLQTEWVDQRQDIPLAPELAQDGSAIARRYIARLGPAVQRADDLSILPPAGATLVLSAYHWNLIPGSSARLQRWVEQGGHLVIDSTVFETLGADAWLPVTRPPVPRDQAPRSPHPCRVLRQRDSLPGAWGDRSGLVACLHGQAPLRSAATPLWALDSEEHGTEVLRVALGRGRVTAFAGRFNFDWQPAGMQPASLSNRGLLAGDNATLLAALIDPQPGGSVWFATRVQRPALPLWLWQQAAPAWLLAALALALALWRGAARFGPLQAEPAAARRAFALQIQGTADFLARYQPQALHAAMLRALNEAASQHLAGWRRMALPARAAALARATGLPAPGLAAALAAGADGSHSGGGDTLQAAGAGAGSAATSAATSAANSAANSHASSARTAAPGADALALLETARRALLHPVRPLHAGIPAVPAVPVTSVTPGKPSP